MKKHCKSCTCFKKIIRHVCWNCKTRKLEKFMIFKGKPITGWGHGGHWFCMDESHCVENKNYGL